MPTKTKMKAYLKKLVTKDSEPPRRREAGAPTTPTSGEVEWKGDAWKKKSPWTPPSSTPTSPSVLASPPPMPAPPADPQDGLGKVASSDKISQGTMAKDRSSPLPWWETADNGDDQQNREDEVKPVTKLRSWDNDSVPWWEQNDDDGGGGGTPWSKDSHSPTESPVSNEKVQQTKSTRARSRQSTENSDEQSKEGSRLLDQYNTKRVRRRPLDTSLMKGFEQKAEQEESNTQRRRRQRPQSSEPSEITGDDTSQSSTNGIVVDKGNYEQVNESLQSVIEDGELGIEEEKDLINKSNDSLGMDVTCESPTLQKENVKGELPGNHKGLKKVNSNKKQIKYNVRHSTWGIENIPEELLEVNRDKSVKLTEFDVWKVEQSTKEVNTNDKGDIKDDKNITCDSWKVENNDKQDSPKFQNLQHNNDVNSMNDNNRNGTEGNLSETVTKSETVKYEKQNEANINNVNDPTPESMDMEQIIKQEKNSEISKSTTADLMETDQENANESQPITDQNRTEMMKIIDVTANQICQSDTPNTTDLEMLNVSDIETKEMEAVKLENKDKVDDNMGINVIKMNDDKVVFDRNQCDAWNFEGIPNLEFEEDNKTVHNMDTDVIENKENKVVFDRNGCDSWNFEGIPNLAIENENDNTNCNESPTKLKENAVVSNSDQCNVVNAEEFCVQNLKDDEEKIKNTKILCLNEEKLGVPHLDDESEYKDEKESSKDEKETKVGYDRHKCDTRNFEECVPNLEEESTNKRQKIELESSKDEEEIKIVFDRNKFDVWNFEDIGVPNLEGETENKEPKNENQSSNNEKEIKIIFDKNNCDAWNFEELGIPNLEDESDTKKHENEKESSNEMESSKDEEEKKIVFDRNKFDVWNFEDIGVPNLEDETKDKEHRDENKSSNDEKETKVVFNRDTCDTWNFGDIGVPNLEDKTKDKEHRDENKSSKDDKETKVVFNRDTCDTWNFGDIGVPDLLETDNQTKDNNMDHSTNKMDMRNSDDKHQSEVVFDRDTCDSWNFGEIGVPNLLETDNQTKDDNMAISTNKEDMRNSDHKHQSEVVGLDCDQSGSWHVEDNDNVKKNKSESKITHKHTNQNQYEDIGIYEDIEVMLPKDVIKEVKSETKHHDDTGIYEDVEIHNSEEKKMVDINMKHVTFDTLKGEDIVEECANDGENENPITDKTHNLNKLNNNSNNKLSEKSKLAETRGNYIIESPTEEKQIQNGIWENEDENVETKNKKSKKNKKSENKKDESLIADRSNKGAEQSDPPKVSSKPKKKIGPTHMVGCYLMAGEADEPEDSSTKAKPAKKAKKSKKNEGDGVVGDLFEVVSPEPKFHHKQTTSSCGAYVCVMDEWDDEPELAVEKPVKKTKKKKKKEVKDEKPGIIIDEERVELLMKEHKAKKEREAMGLTEETSGLQEETNESNYISTHNNMHENKEYEELIVKKRERDSTELKEAEELFEAIDPNVSMDDQLEAMLKWQEEQEEQEKLEEQIRKERLLEKQQKLEQDAEQERKKRDEEKKREDEEWNKKIGERKRKMEDLKHQEEERERKMASEKAKKELEIRFKLEDEAKYRRGILKEQEDLLNTITEDFKSKEAERRRAEEEFLEREEARRQKDIEKQRKEMEEMFQMELELRRRDEERLKRREEYNRKQDEKRIVEEKKRAKLRRQKQEELWKREEERRKKDAERKKQILRDLQEDARKRREEEGEDSDEELPDFDTDQKEKKDGKDWWASADVDTSEDEDLPDISETTDKKKKKKKKKNKVQQDDSWVGVDKDWSSSSRRDFTRDGSPVVEWWASESMGLAPAAPTKVNVGAARAKLLTSPNTNWWDAELDLLQDCIPVPEGVPAPPPPPPPRPGIPGAPPPPPPPPGAFIKKPITRTKKAKLEAIKKAARSRQDWTSVIKDIEGGIQLKKVSIFERNDRSKPILPSSRSKGGKFVYDSEKKNEHNVLLHEIHRGVRLRKAKTNDRSHPDFKALGLKKLRRQNTREEQPVDPLDRLPSSSDEEEDIDKMRDDLQATKGQLEEEGKKRKKLEKENKILKIDIESLHGQVKRIKRQLKDAGIAEAKPLENGDTEIIPSKLQKSLSQIRMLDRRHSEIDFSELENIDLEVNNLKNQLDAQKKLASDYMRLRDEATQKLIISENEVEELEMRSNYFERKYKELQREKGIELPDIEMVGIQTDPIEFADPNKRSTSPVEDDDDDSDEDIYPGTKKSSSRRSFTRQLSRMESFVEEDEDSKKDESSSSSSSESEEESEEEEDEEEQDPDRKAQEWERQIVRDLKEWHSKYERAKDRELNAKKERHNLRERVKKYNRDMKAERENYLKIRQEMDDFKKECKVGNDESEDESEYETDEEAETAVDNEEGGGWWFDEPKPKPKKLKKKKKKVNENGEVEDDEEEEVDLQDLSVFDEPSWSESESESEEEDNNDDTFIKLMNIKQGTEKYEENITIIKKGNYKLKADLERCDEKFGVEKRRRTRLEEELHLALSEVS